MKKTKFLSASLAMLLTVTAMPISATNIIDEYQSIAYQSSSYSIPSYGLSLSTSRARWSYVNKQTMFTYNDTMHLVDATTGSQVVISEINADNSTTTIKTIDFELPLYGGFFAGQDYNYIVFGQTNLEESTSLETYRIVKYDKDFNKISSYSTTGGNTITQTPFSAGSLRMAENADGSELTVHTARQMFASSDGANHQSQITFVLDTKTMTLKNQTNAMQGTQHVSHSFNQFVQYDGDKQILVDHGDAYPRAVVLHESKDGTDYSYYWSSHIEYELLEIPGLIGANCTGVSIGGLEISNSSYLVAINKVDFSKISSFSSYSMTGLDIDERDVMLLVMDKNSKEVNQITIQKYVDTGYTSSIPYIVKIDDDNFMVIWQEHSASTTSGYLTTKFVMVDGSGNKTSAIMSKANTPLSMYVQPLYINDLVTWYVGNEIQTLSPSGQEKVSINSAQISNINTNYTEIGTEITPNPTVILDNTTLILDTDYTVSYSNNLNIGTATITITGIENYTGTITKTFNIIDFADNSTNAWYYDAVKFVVNEGLFGGTSETTFSPSTTMSNGMIWTVLYREQGGTGSTSGAEWYKSAQEWVISNNLSDGENYSADMTREELAVLLYKLENSPSVSLNYATPFQDNDSISSSAKSAMNWAVKVGLYLGNDTNTLNPQGSATRAEVATILMRYLAD